MKKIAVVTSNRAEYGILIPLLRKIDADDELSLCLMVTGAHLSEKYGYTIEQIREDGFQISHVLPILEQSNTATGVSITMANAIKGFSEVFENDRPDMLILLGDRTEILGVAIAAMNANIPIAHLHGGEVTEGAVDDCVRHSLTKMSYLHFAGTEVYRKRIVQMGENPSKVYNVGTLSAENILRTELMSEADIRAYIGIPAEMRYALVTLHPETIDLLSPTVIANMLCDCMEANKDTFFVITGANSDVGGDTINAIFTSFADENENVFFSYSLGMKKYLSALKYASYVIGNSSSGVVEAPIFGVPTINIGNRQSGRIMPETVINVSFEKKAVFDAINRIDQVCRIPSKMYGDGDTSSKIVNIIKQSLNVEIDLKKGFYDINF